jgi:hypothetical protein
MFHMTINADERLKDLQATADELRHERAMVSASRPGLAQGLRYRFGNALLAAGTALVSGAGSATPSRAGR